MMATSSAGEIRESISRLIEVCRDGQYGFEVAAKGVDADPILRAELLQYSGQRQEFVSELRDAMRSLGEEPEDHGSVAGALHRGWIILKQAIATNERAAILAECERGESAAAEAYRREMGSGLPTPIEGIVHTQFQAIARVHDRIQSLYESAAEAGKLQPHPQINPQTNH